MENQENNHRRQNSNIKANEFFAPTPSTAPRNQSLESQNINEFIKGPQSSHYLDIAKQNSNLYTGGMSSYIPSSPMLPNASSSQMYQYICQSNMTPSSTPNILSNSMHYQGLKDSNLRSVNSLNNQLFSPLMSPASSMSNINFYNAGASKNYGIPQTPNTSNIPLGSNYMFNPNATPIVSNIQLNNNQGNISQYSSVATPKSSDMSSITQTTDLKDKNHDEKDIISQLQNHGSYPEEILPKLQNIVSTANLMCELDLRKIALTAKNAEYNPKRFAAVIMRIKEPKTTALIFKSGKMVCTGARSEEDSKKAARQYAKYIRKLGFDVKFSEFTIQNIVGSCDVKFKISLEGLSMNNKLCNYDPEVFPGLIYKMVEPKIVLLIFFSGKIVLTGAKTKEQIYAAFDKIYPLLFKFKQVDK